MVSHAVSTASVAMMGGWFTLLGAAMMGGWFALLVFNAYVSRKELAALVSNISSASSSASPFGCLLKKTI